MLLRTAYREKIKGWWEVRGGWATWVKGIKEVLVTITGHYKCDESLSSIPEDNTTVYVN